MMGVDDVKEILGIEVIGVVPESPGVLSASNAGVPVILDEGSDAGQAYADAVARLCGEDRPMRFIDATKKGFLARIFGS
jgi:septum site-determining protein MinD